jgi:hypothetical protein
MRPAPLVPLAPARRAAEVRRLAELALRRLTRLADPQLGMDDGWTD